MGDEIPDIPQFCERYNKVFVPVKAVFANEPDPEHNPTLMEFDDENGSPFITVGSCSFSIYRIFFNIIKYLNFEFLAWFVMLNRSIQLVFISICTIYVC